jgi:CheY-like chemotaxis protein
MNPSVKKRVLIIDDDTHVRNVLTRLLTRNGYNVSASSGGKKALVRLRGGEEFDCIITDLMMPNFGGQEFVAALAREGLCPLNRVLILTAVHHADNATAYIQYGCAGYCGKPWSNERILDQVARICQGSPKGGSLQALV